MNVVEFDFQPKELVVVQHLKDRGCRIVLPPTMRTSVFWESQINKKIVFSSYHYFIRTNIRRENYHDSFKSDNAGLDSHARSVENLGVLD